MFVRIMLLLCNRLLLYEYVEERRELLLETIKLFIMTCKGAHWVMHNGLKVAACCLTTLKNFYQKDIIELVKGNFGEKILH